VRGTPCGAHRAGHTVRGTPCGAHRAGHPERGTLRKRPNEPSLAQQNLQHHSLITIYQSALVSNGSNPFTNSSNAFICCKYGSNLSKAKAQGPSHLA
jgi:hypothetical protein